MEIQGARIREQGQTFQIVVVKKSVVDNIMEARHAIEYFHSRFFPDVPVVLMGQDFRGRPKYVGRRDIVNFLARISLSRIPWKRYFFN
jgi:hypothetical protein